MGLYNQGCCRFPVGLRASALLSLLSSNESATESEQCPVTAGSLQDISSTDTSSLPSSTTAICSPLLPIDRVSTLLKLLAFLFVKSVTKIPWLLLTKV